MMRSSIQKKPNICVNICRYCVLHKKMYTSTSNNENSRNYFDPKYNCFCPEWNNDGNNYPKCRPFIINWEMTKCVLNNFDRDNYVFHRNNEIMNQYNEYGNKRLQKYYNHESGLLHKLFNAKMITSINNI